MRMHSDSKPPEEASITIWGGVQGGGVQGFARDTTNGLNKFLAGGHESSEKVLLAPAEFKAPHGPLPPNAREVRRERWGWKGGGGKGREGKCNILGIFQFLFAKVLRKNLGLSKTWVSVSGSYAMSAEADMGI